MTSSPNIAGVSRYFVRAKRRPQLSSGIERAAAAMLFAALVPALALVAIAIAMLSRRGPLVSHRRVGLHGQTLPMLKFRTMWSRDDSQKHFFAIEEVSDNIPGIKCRGDARVCSRFAAFCRRHSIDELPQLYHVARGQMALVGPRPVTRPELEAHYGGCVDEVLSVPPGMTGLWQVRGRNRLTYARRRRLDLILVRRRSPKMYVWILWRSVSGVLTGDGAC